jgi:regulator of PEP synthase PpsR (kinase-PPPase family)
VEAKRSKPAAKPNVSPTPAQATQPLPVPVSVSAPAPAIGPKVLHLLSDSTGNLGQHMVTAFLTQFPVGAFVLRRWPFLTTEEQIWETLWRLSDEPGIVMHAVVSPTAKKMINGVCERHHWPVCDLTGSFVDFLASASGIAPTPDVNRLHDMSPEYRARIKAMEFTLEHDDGLGLETLHEAQIVLVGVSRTSKTPTSIYLGQQGYRVANIALAMQVEPPQQLLALKTKNVVGLLINPRTLSEIRTNRNVSWRMTDTNYNELHSVSKELAWSRALFEKQGWHTLDVTDQAIEETAGRIIHMLGLKPPSGESE